MLSVLKVHRGRGRKVRTPEEIAAMPLYEWDQRLQKRNLARKEGVNTVKNEVRFTALMTADDHKRLLAIAAQSGDSKNQVLRRGLRALYMMEVLGRPTCANGHNCFVPNMHQNLQMQINLVKPVEPGEAMGL